MILHAFLFISDICLSACYIMSQIKVQDLLLISGFILTGLGIVAAVLVYFCKRKRQSDDELHRMLWKINYDDIEFATKPPTGSQIGKSYKSLVSLKSAVSNGNYSSVISKEDTVTPTARYKGTTVAFEAVYRPKGLEITKQHLNELKQVKDMTHENINSFIGACVNESYMYILSPYCAKGSVRDILEHKEIKLDNLFKNSLISDLAHGMKYIHGSSIQSHGHLRSSCCLVDSRWILKVADFGLHWLKRPGVPAKENELLWCAPELLRLSKRPVSGTQKADVYSFAIILQEILFRASPFFKDFLNSTEIIQKVKQVRRSPYRPNVNKVPEDMDLEMMNLMQECWDEQPENRPHFSDVIKRIIKINKGRKINILDNMVQKLEKYANNLEEIVQQRTEELVQEKKKTDQLLYKMMPSVVAESLKCGQPVTPELYDSATVYFSDIVGFTSLSSMSTPIQVVDLLNDLYTCFDDIIATFDVYKVETIGDAYMCVSGIPRRNGNRHAAHIADMALAIREAVSVFKIRHMPDTLLMVRIGVHTGSCAAGVVGLTMPRYCLFGDTVNTASRMESNSLAMKIHLSEEAYQVLQDIGGYRIKRRGEIEIKGKGKVTTYWLLKKENTSSCFL